MGDNCVQNRAFTYNSLSRLISATNPESGTINYSYDANGNLTSKTDARGVVTSYVYDALNRVTQRSYSTPNGTPGVGVLANYQATPKVEYFYDGANVAGGIPNSKGKLTKVSSTVSTTEYTAFDILGRVTAHKQTTDGTAYTTGYVYNLSGGLVEETYPSGRVVKNVLDADGDLSIVQSRKNQAAGFFNYAKNFTYNAAGAVTSMQLGNGLWESTQFNSRLQPTQIALGTVQNGADKLKLEYGYGTTANNGNVLSQKITVKRPSQSDLVFDQIYTYDSLNRITSAEEKTGTTVNWNQTYMFDRYGNRNFNESLTTTLPKGCVDGWNPVMCVADRKVFNPELNPANNRMAANQGWAYDPAGNTTADPQGRTFTYDAENKQIEVKNSLSATVGQYFFDGDGKRVKKVVPTSGEVTIFIYDAGAKLIGEYSAIVQSVQDAKVQYLTNDHLGSPRINTDRDGNVTSRTDYFPYGEEIIALGGRSSADKYVADDVRQGFTGYERDVEIDLDFAQARYYSPKHGRFTSPDEVFADQYEENPQSWNLYSYVRNNPLNLVDPSGMKADCPPRKVCTYDENGKLLSVEDDKEPIVIETKVKRETQVGTADTMAIGGLIRPIIQWFIRFFTRSPKPRPAPAPKPPPQPQPPVQPPPVAPVSPPVPPHVQNVLNQIKNAGGKPPSGFKGGRIFKNDGRGGGQVLPKTDSAGNPIKYKEYDVNPYQKGVNRGAERLVRGTSDGKTYHTYYSNDHYRTFVKIE